MARDRRAKVAQDILAIIKRLVDVNGTCQGRAMISTLARETHLSATSIEAYLKAMASIKVIALRQVREARPPGYSRPRLVPHVTLLKPNAVIVMRAGFLAVAEPGDQ